MSANSEFVLTDYLNERLLPSYWCPGCGMGTTVQSLLRAIHKLNWGKDEVVIVSGIGCSARFPSYTDYSGVQSTHGRALAFATGIKMANPDLHVVLLLGDGDVAAIGGNHLLHAARRNIDLTVVVVNNMIYGMTGGQVSPTTPFSSLSTTSPDGNLEPAMDICGIAQAAGATYVAKTTVYHVTQMLSYIEKGLRNKGFSLIEVLTPCQTNFGRRNGFKSSVEMLKSFRDNSTFLGSASKGEDNKKIQLGEFTHIDRPEYTDVYKNHIEVLKNELEPENDRKTSKSLGMHETIKKRTDIRLSGLGGQGLQLLGMLYAEASIIDGSNAAHLTSYGPEARGGASRSDIVLSPWEESIHYPEVMIPNILMALTQEAYNKYKQKVSDLIIVDSTYVQIDATEQEGSHVRIVSLPIIETARRLIGSDVGVGTVAISVLASLINNVSKETFLNVLAKALNEKVYASNLKALDEGWNMGAGVRDHLTK